MGSIKTKDSFENLEKAFKTLDDIVNWNAEDETIKRDSTIQRFEYTIELFWKTFRRHLLFNGVREEELKFPRSVVEKAYQARLIDNEEVWIKMLMDRNKTSHIYDEDEIITIYKNILNDYYPEMKISFEKLKKEITK